MILRKVLLVGLVLGLSGCAAIEYPLPTCSGLARRPLNKSMWDWDKGSLSLLDEVPGSAGGAVLRVVANAFDITGSYRSCNG